VIEVPRITCAGICHVILVKVTVPGPGLVGAEQLLAVAGFPAMGAAFAGKSRKPKLLVQPATATATAAGTVTLSLKVTKTGKKTLKRKHKLTFPLRITYTPTGGTPSSQTTTVTATKGKKKRH
jgi:hypothetical protein